MTLDSSLLRKIFKTRCSSSTYFLKAKESHIIHPGAETVFWKFMGVVEQSCKNDRYLAELRTSINSLVADVKEQHNKSWV